MTAAIPTTPTEITPAFLTGALRERGLLDGEVTDVVVEEIGVGRGYVGLTLRVRPVYSEGASGPASMVAKLPTMVDLEPQDKMLVNMLYKNEISFYANIAEACPVRRPKAYWGGMDEVNGHFCLLLEDLGDMAQFSQAEGCTADQARMIVRHLARLHAKWWGGAELASQPWMMPGEMGTMLLGGLMQMGWPTYWTLVGPTLPPEFEGHGAKLVQQFGPLGLSTLPRSRTLSHGDFRVENFLFGEAGTANELVILDWQLLSSSSGLYDVAYFISQSLTTEVRRACEEELLDLYYGTLLSEGVTGYSKDDLRLDYRIGLLGAMAVPINGARSFETVKASGGGEGLLPEEQELVQRALVSGFELLNTMSQRCVAAIYDNNAHELLT